MWDKSVKDFLIKLTFLFVFINKLIHLSHILVLLFFLSKSYFKDWFR